MANRQLTANQRDKANRLLAMIRERLEALSAGDRELLFAYRRKIYKELVYDERSKPMVRRRLKLKKREEQQGLCPSCGKVLPEKYAVLDRFNAAAGYTVSNTRLIHGECDVRTQKSRRYA